MDIRKESEIVLRDAGYSTWPWTSEHYSVVCFENEAILGFAFFFDSTDQLIDGWEAAQNVALARFRPALKGAGDKAWNVYSVFLTSGSDDGKSLYLDRIEENFKHTRKIAQAGVLSKESLKNALLPLLPIRNRPSFDASNIHDRLQSSLNEINLNGAKAFLKDATPDDIAEILAEK